MSTPLYPQLSNKIVADEKPPDPDSQQIPVVHYNPFKNSDGNPLDGVVEIEQELHEPDHPYKDPLEVSALLADEGDSKKSKKAPPRAKKIKKERSPDVVRSLKFDETRPAAAGNDDEEKRSFIPGTNGGSRDVITEEQPEVTSSAKTNGQSSLDAAGSGNFFSKHDQFSG